MTDDKALQNMQDAQWLAEADAEAVLLDAVKESLGMVKEVVPFAQLAGQTIELLGARAHKSELEGQGWYLFCPFRFVGDARVYGTAIGAAQPIEVIMRYLNKGGNAPLQVKVTYHENKGRHDGYYTLD